MSRTIARPVPASIQKALGRKATTHIHLFDSPGQLAEAAQAGGRVYNGDNWSGGLSPAEAVRRSNMGDLDRVAPSDSLLSRFERFGFEAPRRAWVDDVTGAVPNVPAFLAGHPLAMRRRVKIQDAAAPLAVIVDLTSSSNVDASDLERRGAAILALVRILSARRPVELWAGCATDADGCKNASVTLARIETAPLDLARAAFVMVGASFPRQLCYGLSRARNGFAGSWPYGSHTISRTMFRDMIADAFPHVSDMLCIPAAHSDDQIHKNPEVWIESKLAEMDCAPAEAA
jgi:hypothetical protein